MENFHSETCRNCGSSKFKSWKELTDDEKFVVERLPDNIEFTNEQREKHRFCQRCFYSMVQIETNKI